MPYPVLKKRLTVTSSDGNPLFSLHIPSVFLIMAFVVIFATFLTKRISHTQSMNITLPENLFATSEKIHLQSSITPDSVHTGDIVSLHLLLTNSDINKVRIEVTDPNGMIASQEMNTGDEVTVSYPGKFLIGSNPLDSFQFAPTTTKKGKYTVQYFVSSDGFSTSQDAGTDSFTVN